MKEPGRVRSFFGGLLMFLAAPFLLVGTGVVMINRWMDRRIWKIRGRATKISWFVNLLILVMVAGPVAAFVAWLESDSFKTLFGIGFFIVCGITLLIGFARWLLQRVDGKK